MLDSFIDWVRAFNGVLALADLWLLISRLLYAWKKLADGQRTLFVSISMILISSVWGSVELVLQKAPVSYRAILLGLGLIWLFVYLVEPMKNFMHRAGHDPLSGRDFRNVSRQSGSSDES